MSWLYLITGVVVAVLCLYLLVAMLNPEIFP